MMIEKAVNVTYEAYYSSNAQSGANDNNFTKYEGYQWDRTETSTVYTTPLLACAETTKTLNLPFLGELANTYLPTLWTENIAGTYEESAMAQRDYVDPISGATRFNYRGFMYCYFKGTMWGGFDLYESESYFEITDGTTTYTTTDVKLTAGRWTATYSYKRYAPNSTGYIVKFIYTFEAVEQAPVKQYTYSIWSAAQRCLDLAIPLFNDVDGNGYQGRYVLDDSQRDWLDSVKCPDLSLTRATLREQLKTLGGFVHAEPRLVYPNIIHFDKYESGRAFELPESLSNQNFSQSINDFCTKLDSIVSNLVNQRAGDDDGTIVDPSGEGYRSLRTESINIRVEDTNASVETAYPVQLISKIMCGIYNTDGTSWYVEPVDITNFCFESTAYNAMLSSYEGSYPVSKAYGIYYTFGAKGIHGLFFKEPNAISPVFETFAISNILEMAQTIAGAQTVRTRTDIDLYLAGDAGRNISRIVFQVTYAPIYEMYTSHSKPIVDVGATAYGRSYAQGENLVDGKFYGRNLKGAAARMGNLSRELTYYAPTDFDALPRIGDCIKGTYFVASVLVAVYPQFFKVTIGLSKNFNRLSPYIGVDSIKRVYEVSERQAYTRNINIHEYVMIGDSVSEFAFFNQAYTHPRPLYRSIAPIEGILAGTPVAPMRATHIVMNGEDDEGDTSAFNTVVLPCIASSAGNTVNLSWQMKDNYSAGAQLVYQQAANDGQVVWGWWQQDVPYGDYFGRVERMHFAIGTNITALKTNAGANNLPLVEGATIEQTQMSTENAFPYLIEKDGRENLAFTYTLEYVSNREGMFVGGGLADFDPIATDDRPIAKAAIYGVRDFVSNFTDEIKLISGDYIFITEAEIEHVSDYVAKISGFELPAGFNSWVIVHETVVGAPNAPRPIYIGGRRQGATGVAEAVPDIYLTLTHKIQK